MRFNNGLGPSQMETGEEDIRVELVRRKAWGRVGEQVRSGNVSSLFQAAGVHGIWRGKMEGADPGKETHGHILQILLHRLKGLRFSGVANRQPGEIWS